MLDPRLRLGRSQRAIVSKMLEMGWLFSTVVHYNQSMDGENRGIVQVAHRLRGNYILSGIVTCCR